jgi:hypothetical protein
MKEREREEEKWYFGLSNELKYFKVGMLSFYDIP